MDKSQKQLRSWPLLGVEALPHTVVLGLCLIIILLAVILKQPATDEQTLSLASVPLPTLCMIKRYTGFDCPGCGLTRSFVAAMHGNLAGSFGWHRLGPLALLYTWAQILRHSLWLAWPQRRESVEVWGRYLDQSLLLLASLYPINWILKWF